MAWILVSGDVFENQKRMYLEGRRTEARSADICIPWAIEGMPYRGSQHCKYVLALGIYLS